MQSAPGDRVLPDLDPQLSAEIGLVLVAAGIALAPLAVILVRRIFPGRNVTFARWGFSHVLLVAATVVLSAVVIGALSSALFPPAEGDLGITLVGDLSRTALAFSLAAAAAAAIARKLSPEGIRALGFPPGRTTRAVVAGVLAYAILVSGILGLGFLWIGILAAFGVEPEGQELIAKFLELPRSELPIAIAFGVLVMPFLEELLFRGFLQPLLVQNFSEKGGIVLTSFLFAALHGLQAFLPIFGLSLLLGALMLRTQRLLACWLVHALHNGLTLAFVLGSREMLEALEQGLLP